EWPGFNAGMRASKGSAYDGGHRTPLFIRWPAAGWKTGRDVSDLVCHLDVFPTLLDLCAIRLPADHIPDGRSLAPVLRGTGGVPQRTHFIQHAQVTIGGKYQMEDPRPWRNAVALRGKWRLVNGEELYNLEHDPGQQKNVAADFPAILKDLRHDY